MKKVDFNKFDKAEQKIKEAEDSVQELALEVNNSEGKELLTKAAMDLEKAEAEVEEVDEGSF